ncbi:MAG TPA: hypothetical protein DCP11_13850 [Microbacteriaceae bacterium]|nr:hypothetical protein [Microbacteriaceae bacterium]
MLFDVTAILNSGALGGVAEAFVAHEMNQLVSHVSAADPSVQDPSGISSLIGPYLTPEQETGSATILSSAVDPSMLPKLGGTALLNELALFPSSQISSYLIHHPFQVNQMLSDPPSARSVASMWSMLSVSSQKALAKSAPQLVGNLDGVPFDMRDAANRRFLRQSIATLEASIESGAGRATLVEDRHHLDILKQVQRTLKRSAGDPPRQLLTFDPRGEARAAVVVGNLETADYVSYLVPGMFFTVQGQMYDWTVIAQDLYKEQTSWIKLLAKSDTTMVGKTSATVSWIGYTTPGALDIGSLDRANEGARLLGNAVQGIQTVREGSEPYVTLVTHSYGSTAAMIELAKGGVTVDALAIVGSPGSATQSAARLSVRNDNVYVGEAAWDPVVNTAFYGSDPGSPSFGAKKMSVAGGVDVITRKDLAPAIGHLGYFDADTEAMRNLALIGIDEGPLVTNGTLADASRTIASAR